MAQQTEIKIVLPGAVTAEVTQRVVGEADPDPTPTPEPAPEPTPLASKISLIEFGATGDGKADDGAALAAALQYAADNGRMIEAPPLLYRIATAVKVNIHKSTVQKWGLTGGTFQSELVNGEDIITIEAAVDGTYPRNMSLGGFMIRGSAKDGAGLVLRCTGGGWSQNLASDLVVENVGGDGLVIEGEFFESTFIGLRFMDCHKGSGVVAANLANGKNISSLRFLGLNVAQCGAFGFLATGRDNPWNAPQDCQLGSGYIRQCGQGGARFYLGGYLDRMMFENNCTTGGDAHVHASGPFWASQCRGDMSMQSAKATYLFDLNSGSGNHEAVLRDCVHRDNGWGGATKLAKLGGTHYTTIDECSGDVDGTGGGYTRIVRGVKTDVPKG